MTKELPKRQGVFVPAGSRFVIPAGSIIASIGPDGEFKMEMGPIHLSRDMTPTWIRIAVSLLPEAEAAHAEVLAILESGSDDGLGEALERESAASMQAVIAAATAFDALYASASDRIKLPPSLVKRWRDNGTARWRQVAEVMKRAFRTPQGEPASNLRESLKTLYQIRDMAVHPSGAAAQVVFHPDLRQGTDWRFVTFSYSNALQLVWIAIGFTHALLSISDRRDSEAITAFRAELLGQLEPDYESWRVRYGDVETNPVPGGSA